MTQQAEIRRGGGTVIGRRRVLKMLMAAGVLVPLVGTGRAQAAAGNEPWEIPEESGALAWT